MELSEFLEGKSLTGWHAAMIVFGFLVLVVLAAIVLILFSDVFRNLITMAVPVSY